MAIGYYSKVPFSATFSTICTVSATKTLYNTTFCPSWIRHVLVGFSLMGFCPTLVLLHAVYALHTWLPPVTSLICLAYRAYIITTALYTTVELIVSADCSVIQHKVKLIVWQWLLYKYIVAGLHAVSFYVRLILSVTYYRRNYYTVSQKNVTFDVTLKVQAIMLCYKKTSLYNLLCVLVCYIFLTSSKPGGVALEITYLCHISR